MSDDKLVIRSLVKTSLVPWNEKFKRLAEREDKKATCPCINFFPHPKNNLQVLGNFNYKAHMVYDMYTNEMFKKHILPTPGRLEMPYITEDDIPNLIRAVNVYRSGLEIISYTDLAFKKEYGLWHWSNNEVCNVHKDFSRLRIEGTCWAYFEPEDPEHWHQIEVFGTIAEIVVKTTGRFNPGRKKPGENGPKEPEPEHLYTFVPGFAGVLFLQVMQQGKITLLEKKFYHYKPFEQNLIRYCSQMPYLKTRILLREVPGLMEWKKPENGMEIWWLVDRFEKRLEDMKTKRLIWDWGKTKVKGEVEWWVILKYDYRVLPPKRDPEEPDDILSFRP